MKIWLNYQAIKAVLRQNQEIKVYSRQSKTLILVVDGSAGLL